jgi:serine/threonine protein kinase/tetratricopeptide (TPR) repeat protein
MPNAVPTLDTIFGRAVELTDAAARAAYLARACGADEPLRLRVEALVDAYFRAGSFLESEAGLAAGTAAYSPDPDKPGAMIGPYKLLERIGQGGMGVVYVAEQTEPVRRRVALKVIKPGMDTKEVVARFEAERQALALMDHPNIAKVFDGGTTAAGRPFFVMELVRGLPVTEYCDRAKLPADRRLRLFAQVCRAVQHAHQKGVIHRDIKPSNVLVTLHDGEPVPKVIDFGVAKALNQRLTDKSVYTRLAQLVGTPLYMSPEQAELSGLDVDTRSDVYSLGVLLYELLTGTTPFDPETFRTAAFDELRRMIREDEPPRPSARVSTLDAAARSTAAGKRGIDDRQFGRLLRGDLDWIVMTALEKDRNRRYESAGAFAADVERFLMDEPVQARPPSVAYKLRKFARRNKATLATAVVIAFAILAVAGTLGWTMRDAATRRGIAEQGAADALAETDRWESVGRWGDALTAATRAVDLVSVTDVREDLRTRALSRRDDLAIVIRLDEIRMGLAPSLETKIDSVGTDRLYSESFRSYGLDPDALTPAEVARRMPSGAVRAELIAGLDVWAWVRRRADNLSGSSRLLDAIKAVEPESWKSNVLFTGIAEKTLREFRASGSLDRVHPSLLVLLVEQLEPQEAVAFLRDAQQRHPNDFWLNYELGQQLLRSRARQADEAVGYFRAALALRPDSAKAQVRLGAQLSDMGRWDEAIPALDRAIRLNPGYALAHNCRGITLAASGKPTEAIAAFREAIRLNPTYTSAHCHLARILLTNGSADEALAVIREANRIAPNDSDVLHALGMILERKGDVDGAEAAYRRSLELKPASAETLNSLGAILCDARHDYDGAIDAFARALDLGLADVGPLRSNLARALRHKGAPVEAAAAEWGLYRPRPPQTLSATRIADTSTPIPEGTGTFTSLLAAPSIFGPTVAFHAKGPGQEGYYTASITGGRLTKVADLTTPIPGGTGTFSGFTGDPFTAVSGSRVEFRGMGANGHVGIYTAPVGGGPLAVVADTNIPIPHGSGNFSGMSNVSFSGLTVAFVGGNRLAAGHRGLYVGSALGGPLTRIVDVNTPIPSGSGTFTGMAHTSVSGSTVAFRGMGGDGQNGIYAAPSAGGPVTVVADTNTPIPGGTGNFKLATFPSVSGSTVAFCGKGVGQEGIYVGPIAGGRLTRLADLNSPVPNGHGKLFSFTIPPFNHNVVAMSGSAVAFQAIDGERQVGIYIGSADGTGLRKLIAAGDTLDGRRVSWLTFDRTGLDGATFAFIASFTDGTSGVYVGRVPGP